MKVHILSRTFGTELAPLPLGYAVESYSHAAIGGPKMAMIDVSGNELDLWTLVDRLRCPISIWSDLGDCVWWGYVAEVRMMIGALEVSITIDSMFNRIAVAYQDASTKARATTAWLDDATSQAEYGVKEMLYAISETDTAAALGARTAMLQQLKYPIPGISVKGGQAAPLLGQLVARGWWDTLNWQYYTNAGIAAVDTAAQAATILSSEGQFLSSVGNEVGSSGVTTVETRTGDQSARVEVEELLAMGTSNNRRMLVGIDQGRRARLYEEPSHTSPWLVERTGWMFDAFGSELRRELCPVGNYLRMRDLTPSSANMSALADPAMIFVEEAEYTPSNGELRITPRGVPSIYDLGRTRNG